MQIGKGAYVDLAETPPFRGQAPANATPSIDHPARTAPTSPIRVSELGDWVYCHLAWKLRREGAAPTPEAEARADESRAWHAEHGEVVAHAIRARRVRDCCLVRAVCVAALLLILWAIRR